MPLPSLSLVLGGASSGKSAFAEALCLQRGSPALYVATAQPFDAEMAEKIARHRASRSEEWQTIEAPLDVVAALKAIDGGMPVLIDCATLWLTNHLVAESDLAAVTNALAGDLVASPNPVVVVSNEVGQGIVPEHALSRRFRDAQGRLNQSLAARADLVVQVIAGLPNVLKGTLP